MSIVAHAGGMGWDEALVFAAPVVILIALQIAGRRKKRDGDDPDEDEPDHDGEDEDGETA